MNTIKKFIESCLIGFVLVIIFSNFNKTYAQTDGNLSFAFSQAAPSTSATKNVMAIWIEDSATGSFIKTKMRFWSTGTNDHLPSWVANSSQNVTDATTGATRTSSTSPAAFGAKTITWDGKGAVSGTTVPDGVYKIMIESSYCNPQPNTGQHWILCNFSFTKGPNAVHLTPTGPANFSNISLDWVPSTSSVETINANPEVNIFPNPSNGIINLSIKQSFTGTIKVENIIGATIFEEEISTSNATVKTIDLSKFAKGSYYVNILPKSNGELQKLKLVLTK